MSNYNELMSELRIEYLESFPEKYELIQALGTDKDWKSLEMEFHKLKGTGRTYGVPEISTLCEKLEHLSRMPEALTQRHINNSIQLMKMICKKYLEGFEFTLETNSHYLEIKQLC